MRLILHIADPIKGIRVERQGRKTNDLKGQDVLRQWGYRSEQILQACNNEGAPVGAAGLQIRYIKINVLQAER